MGLDKIENIEDEIHNTIGEKCNKHGNEIPLDDDFCLSCLLRIPTGEDEVVSSHEE